MTGTTRTGSRAGRKPALGIRQADGHEHGPILSVFVTASLSDPLPRDARREPLACRPGLDRSATNQHELRRSGRGRMARRRSQGCRMIRSDPRTGLGLDRSAAACLAGGSERPR